MLISRANIILNKSVKLSTVIVIDSYISLLYSQLLSLYHYITLTINIGNRDVISKVTHKINSNTQSPSQLKIILLAFLYNLPKQVSSIIGRRNEQANLRKIMSLGKVRTIKRVYLIDDSNIISNN